MTSGFSLFDTAIGTCGLAWTAGGIRAVNLPEADRSATRARLIASCPGAEEGAPPPEVAKARDAMIALLAGHPADLSDIELDMEGVPAFHRAVFAAARAVTPGSTVTYGELARRIGEPGAARAVGQALGKNPFTLIVPCHRILAKGGKSGGFSAPGGVKTKLRLLAIEGAQMEHQCDLFSWAE